MVREIGRGGMGRVFLAERADGEFEQRVAVKLLQHASPGLVRRFLEERRILARLDHPGIARLIDGGVVANGLPYFALEYVEGEHVDRYCAARDLPQDGEASLELLFQLIGALADLPTDVAAAPLPEVVGGRDDGITELCLQLEAAREATEEALIDAELAPARTQHCH